MIAITINMVEFQRARCTLCGCMSTVRLWHDYSQLGGWHTYRTCFLCVRGLWSFINLPSRERDAVRRAFYDAVGKLDAAAREAERLADARLLVERDRQWLETLA
jgi:hypothetical protein